MRCELCAPLACRRAFVLARGVAEQCESLASLLRPLGVCLVLSHAPSRRVPMVLLSSWPAPALGHPVSASPHGVCVSVPSIPAGEKGEGEQGGTPGSRNVRSMWSGSAESVSDGEQSRLREHDVRVGYRTSPLQPVQESVRFRACAGPSNVRDLLPTHLWSRVCHENSRRHPESVGGQHRPCRPIPTQCKAEHERDDGQHQRRRVCVGERTRGPARDIPQCVS
jgi:hypothetical protein